MPRLPVRLLTAFLGAIGCTLCGCGAEPLAAVEDPQSVTGGPVAETPAESEGNDGEPEPAAETPTTIEPPAWDFFGPPQVAEATTEQAEAETEHLHLRGFWEIDGVRKAQLWIGPEIGGAALILGVGESRRGVTVVELGEETATVERPERVVLRMEPVVGGSTPIGSSPLGRRPATRAAVPNPRSARERRPIESGSPRGPAFTDPARAARRSTAPPPLPPAPTLPPFARQLQEEADRAAD
ncbi:MAG: hypothetical protein AAF907_01855 [Planctomycetota bacterium]